MKMLKRLRSLRNRIQLARAGQWEKARVVSELYGLRIGDRVRILGSVSFGSEPYLVRLGDDVTLTDGVRFITHDGGAALFRHKTPGLNVFGPISIGTNVFIGTGTIVLPGVTIGDNVVVGAGSVVAQDIPDSSVAAGNPAKVIRSLGEYEQRIRARGVTLTESDPVRRRSQIEAFIFERLDGDAHRRHE